MDDQLNVLDLFSGIGGFSLGLERAGMRTVAFCEIESFPQQVLKKNFPGVPIYEDVCALTADKLRSDGIKAIDVITGGFPCQDLSIAGAETGLDGARSGLWKELCRYRDGVITEAHVLHYYIGTPNHEGDSYGHIEVDLPAEYIDKTVLVMRKED